MLSKQLLEFRSNYDIFVSIIDLPLLAASFYQHHENSIRLCTSCLYCALVVNVHSYNQIMLRRGGASNPLVRHLKVTGSLRKKARRRCTPSKRLVHRVDRRGLSWMNIAFCAYCRTAQVPLIPVPKAAEREFR